MEPVTKMQVRFNVEKMIADAEKVAVGFPEPIVPASYIKGCQEQIEDILGNDFSFTTPEAFWLKRMSDYHKAYANCWMYLWAFKDIFEYCPF